MGAVLSSVKINKRDARLKEIDVEAEIAEGELKAAYAAKKDAERDIVRYLNESLRLKRERLLLVNLSEKERLASLAAILPKAV